MSNFQFWKSLNFFRYLRFHIPVVWTICVYCIIKMYCFGIINMMQCYFIKFGGLCDRKVTFPPLTCQLGMNDYIRPLLALVWTCWFVCASVCLHSYVHTYACACVCWLFLSDVVISSQPFVVSPIAQFHRMTNCFFI